MKEKYTNYDVVLDSLKFNVFFGFRYYGDVPLVQLFVMKYVVNVHYHFF